MGSACKHGLLGSAFAGQGSNLQVLSPDLILHSQAAILLWQSKHLQLGDIQLRLLTATKQTMPVKLGMGHTANASRQWRSINDASHAMHTRSMPHQLLQLLFGI